MSSPGDEWTRGDERRESRAVWVGGSTFNWRLHADGMVENIPLASNAPYHVNADGLFRWDDPEAVERGEYFGDVELTLDIYRADGRLFCGGASLRTVAAAPERTDIARQLSESNTLGPNVSAEVTARLWRRIPLGAVIDHALESIRTAPERYPQASPDVLALWRENADSEAARPKPGPRTALTDELLATVVAPAYLAGGSKPVQAVREALEAAGYSKGFVTIDQARKAVQRARKQGFLPAVQRKTGQPANISRGKEQR